MRKRISRMRNWVIGATVVLVSLALLSAWQRHAARTGAPDMVALLTTPVGTLISGDRPPAREPRTPAVKVTPPLTGGGADIDDSLAVGERPVVKGPAPLPKAADRTAEPRRTPVSPPDGIAITQPGIPADVSRGNARDETAIREPELRPTTGSARLGMQPGAVVANGRQAPALTLALAPSQIRDLVAAGKCVVVVENEQSREVFFLDRPDGAFRPINELAVASVSERYVPVSDPGLISAWSVRLGHLPEYQFTFGLRFTRGFDEAILERQFASLAARGIDFDQALVAHRVVTTHGKIGPGLAVAIERVSVEEPRRVSTE